jgi:hypothetical protein
MTFSIRSIMVLTAVMAATAAGTAHLWRSANGDPAELGSFIIVTSLGPLGLMIVASWCFRIFGKQLK